MSINDIVQAIGDSTVAGLIGGNNPATAWLFPIIETMHVVALATVFGSIAMVDARLLGLASRDSAVTKLSEEVLPWTWTAFIVAAITGSLMFIAKAPTYWHNTQFDAKFIAMFLAGINMLAFHFGVYRNVSVWDRTLPTPVAARVAGGISICLWVIVIFMGRWIGFTT